jgi:lipopolysaccharide export system protein LptA
MIARLLLLPALSLAVALAVQGDPLAHAQTKGDAKQPSAFEGFSRDNKEPVRIEANAFEVHDKDRYAVFIGNVVVQQGESTMRSRELKVFYEGSIRGADKGAAPAKAPAAKAAGNDPAQRIRRLEAHGGVIITNKDQKATGDLGVLDMPTNTATITGNVVLTQGPNVMRGDKLVVDLKTGYSRLEAGAKKKDGTARVEGLFVPSSDGTKKDDTKKPAGQK